MNLSPTFDLAAARLSRLQCGRSSGPKRTFIPTPSAALQLLQTGHSLRVLDFFSV